MNRRC